MLRIVPLILLIPLTFLWVGEFACAQIENPNWPAGTVPRDQLSQERSWDYDFSEISVPTLQTWLGRFGIESPVKLDGILSGWIWAQRSQAGWLDFSGYRIEGQIGSPKLGLDQWNVADATVRFGYTKGTWYVGKLGGQLQSPIDQSNVGEIKATAKVTTAAPSRTELNAMISDVDLSSLFAALGLELEISNQGGKVTLKGSVPTMLASDLTKWRASGMLDLKGVSLPWFESPGKADLGLSLASGAWEINRAQVDVADQVLNFSGKGRLDGEFPFAVSAEKQTIDLRQLITQLKFPDLAEQFSGAVTLNADLAGTLTTGIERVSANGISDRLVVGDQPIEQLEANGRFTSQGIRLEVNSAETAGGTVTGWVGWQELNQLSRGIPSSAKLNVEQIQLNELKWLASPVSLRGQANGQLEFATAVRNQREDWSSAGQLTITGLAAAETELGTANVGWTKTKAASQLDLQLNLQRDQGSLESEVTIRLDDSPNSKTRATRFVDYQANGKLTNYDLLVNDGSADDAQIRLRAIGSFSVAGSKENWLARGNANLSNSQAVLSGRTVRFDLAEASFNEQLFRIHRFRIIDPRGRIAGAAELRRDGQGDHLLRLRAVDVEIQPYLSRFAAQAIGALDGLAEVELKLTKPAATEDLWEGWAGECQGRLQDLEYQGQPLGELGFQGTLADQTVAATAKGELLGGIVQATFALPIDRFRAELPDEPGPVSLEVQVTKAQAERVARLFIDRRNADAISGSGSLNFKAVGSTLDDLDVNATFEIPRVKRNRNVLAEELTARLRFVDKKLWVERLAGGFADGRVELNGQIWFDDQTPTTLAGANLNFLAQRLSANSIVDLILPQYADYYTGVLGYRGRLTYDRGLRATGRASLKQGSLFGIPVQDATCNLVTELNSRGELQRAVTRDLHGSVVGGKLVASLSIEGGSQYHMKTSGNIHRGKLEQIAKSIGFNKIGGSGTFDSSFQLESGQIESLDALTGGVQVNFVGGNVNSIPIVSVLDKYVPLTQFASTKIDNGTLDARFGQGQLRINKVAIFGSALMLFANGSVNLDGSRLDLDAVLQTGGSVQQRLANEIVALASVGAIPQLVAINQLNELLRNRSVFLHVGGSVPRPVIQAKPGQTIAKAFLQNIVRGSVGVPVAGE